MVSILLGLAVLVFLAYKGYNIIWVAPAAAMIVAAAGGLGLFEAYTELYMDGLVSFAKSWFPVFLFGAVFGKLMEVTGLASSVAKMLAGIIGSKRAILAVVIACAVLTYGGVSLFVVVFAIYPLALELFKEADISRKLIPGAIALGSFTFTMTALPGSPQLNNLIAARYLGTTAMAAPVLDITAAVIMLAGGIFYLTWREKQLRAAGEHYTSTGDEKASGSETLPHWIFGILPLIAVIITLNAFQWPAIGAIGTGILLIVLCNIRQWKKIHPRCQRRRTRICYGNHEYFRCRRIRQYCKSSSRFCGADIRPAWHGRQPSRLRGSRHYDAGWRDWFFFRRDDDCAGGARLEISGNRQCVKHQPGSIPQGRYGSLRRAGFPSALRGGNYAACGL